IPLVVHKCFEAIEARGLDREGIYRVSGKLTETAELRLLMETDAAAVNLMDDTGYDINIVASLVKQFFRELPQPIFYFTSRERAEYSQITDERERLVKLRTRVKSLPGANQVLLRALVTHLSKVVANSDKNRMVASNLGLLFAPVVF
ncbi:Rho GTPase-activating protein domain-containing protein, partial [Entophlyctis helioformis]